MSKEDDIRRYLPPSPAAPGAARTPPQWQGQVARKPGGMPRWAVSVLAVLAVLAPVLMLALMMQVRPPRHERGPGAVPTASGVPLVATGAAPTAVMSAPAAASAAPAASVEAPVAIREEADAGAAPESSEEADASAAPAVSGKLKVIKPASSSSLPPEVF